MANKQIKKKKKGNPERRAKILTGLSTLIKNNSVIEVGRNWKWYFPVVMAILSIIIALVPIFSQNMAVKAGNSFFATSYGYEVGLVHFEQELEDKDVSLVIAENKLTNPSNTWSDKIKTDADEPWYQYKTTGTNEVIFEVFYNFSDVDDADFYNRIVANKNPFTETIRSVDADGNAKAYATPFLFLGQNIFYCVSSKSSQNAII